MQLVGLLLIVNSLVASAWWIASGRSQLAVVPICIAALTAGVFLLRQDGGKNGAAKADVPVNAAQQAEIASLAAEAKTLLADLQDQTAVADWHLKQLDEHVQAMQILADGRTKVGNIVTGQPTALLPKLEALQKLAAENSAEALPLAKMCVRLYETTRGQVVGSSLTGGELGPETIAWLYTTAATAAQRAGEHDQTLEWARAAVNEGPTTERQFLLVTALINRNLQAEANDLIQRQLQQDSAEAAKFCQLLEQYKIPYKRSD